jgi:hypothetical protein
MTLYPEQIPEASATSSIATPGFTSGRRRFICIRSICSAAISSPSATRSDAQHHDGAISNLPVSVVREDHTLASEINYAPPLNSSATENTYVFFAQDNWQLHPRFAMISASASNTTAFLQTACTPHRASVLSSLPPGTSVPPSAAAWAFFYDKIPLKIAAFPEIPAQTITQFAPDGISIVQPATTYTHVIPTPNGALRVPDSLGATLQFDRQLRPNLLLRLGYEHRQGNREFFINPVSPTAQQPAQLQLLDSGHQVYDEFLAMFRWQPTERISVVGSYVRSRAYGELNDFNQFFGNFPYPLIRSNQYGPLSSDARNRVLFWGLIGLLHRLQFVPVLDAHTGFPYSKLDQNWNYIGQENGAG